MSAIDFRTMPANVPVLCIPRVYPNITEARIRHIFNELDMGTIDHIDLVSKTSEKGEKFNRVYVHYRYWNNSDNANNARERLLNGKEIKIIYDEPWFWKVSAYRESKPKQTEENNSYTHKKVSIQFDSDERPPEPRDNRYIDKRSRQTYEDKRTRQPYEDKRPRQPYEDKRPRQPYEDKRPRQTYEDKRTRQTYEDKRTRQTYEDKPEPSNVNQLATDEFIENIKEDEEKMKELRVDYGKICIPPVRQRNNKKSKNIVIEEEIQKV
jgi:hypothetical protein